MARQWKAVRAEAVAAGRVDESKVLQEKARMRLQERAFKLAEIRRGQQVTQAQLARDMGVAQPRVSAIERGNLSSTELGTLESYVGALGGRVRVIADFGDESITVQG